MGGQLEPVVAADVLWLAALGDQRLQGRDGLLGGDGRPACITSASQANSSTVFSNLSILSSLVWSYW